MLLESFRVILELYKAVSASVLASGQARPRPGTFRSIYPIALQAGGLDPVGLGNKDRESIRGRAARLGLEISSRFGAPRSMLHEEFCIIMQCFMSN